MLVLSLISTVFADDRGKGATEKNEQPIVTRWKDPLGRPRPRHEPLYIEESLLLNLIEWKPAEGIKPSDLTEGRICIVVHEDVYGPISSNLTQYKVDLVSVGFSVLVYEYSSGSAEDLRSYLAGLYDQAESLVGVVLIGDIPYIIFEMMQEWEEGGDPPEYEDFPCDIFYMDLNGNWSDVLDEGDVQPGNGKYDTREGDTDLGL